MTPLYKNHGGLRVLLFLLLIFPIILHASIAKFSALSGDVSIIESGKSSQATIDSKIDKSDKIVTGENGKAQIVFKDNTVITLGINSDFAIEEYFSDAKKPKASFSIGKGTFKALTGAMGKINPEGFKLKTKTATIGIRGTGILGQVTPTENKIACTQGTITVSPASDPGVVVTVPAGQITSLTPGTPPTPPRAYSPQEVGDIESSSGVGEMPNDTQTQEASGGVEGGTEGATAPAEEEATTEDDATTEGEGTEGEGDTATNEEDTGTEAGATAEDDGALPAPEGAIAGATDIDVADSIAVGGMTSDDQTENFLQETAEALGVDVDRLTGELDGLTLEDLEGLEDIIPEGTTGGAGETYYYADDRDVELYGIFGGGSYDAMSEPSLGAYIDTTGHPSNSVLLEGYKFYVDIGQADPSISEEFSFPRTPVADSYVWYNSAVIAEYASTDGSSLSTLFGSEINNGTVSTWLGGSEIIFFDSKQEFFVYHAVGKFTGTDAYEYDVEKVAVMGKRASWDDKPSYIASYNDVFDGSVLKINYANNRMLSLSYDNGELVVGSITGSDGLVNIQGTDGAANGDGFIFGSELQGFGIKTDDNTISAGYEDISKRRGPSFTLGSVGVTLFGRSIIDDGGITYTDISLNINVGSGTIGATIDASNKFGDDSDPATSSAYLDDSDLAAFGAGGKVLFSTGSDSYTTWGYWGTSGETFYEDKGYWIAGNTDGVESKITTLTDGAHDTTYNYVGWTQGHITNGSTTISASGSIGFDINFASASASIANGSISLGSITKTFDAIPVQALGDFSHDAGANDLSLRGQLYGSGLEKAAGSFKVIDGSQTGIGIFNADKQ